MNAVTHGILSRTPVLPGESPEEWTEFRKEILADLAPVGSVERELAEDVASLFWRRRRLSRAEHAAFLQALEPPAHADAHAHASGASSSVLASPSDERNDPSVSFSRARALARALTRQELVSGDFSLPDERHELPDTGSVHPHTHTPTHPHTLPQPLPDEKTLAKLSRYEAHLSRELSRALKELRVRQERRLAREHNAEAEFQRRLKQEIDVMFLGSCLEHSPFSRHTDTTPPATPTAPMTSEGSLVCPQNTDAGLAANPDCNKPENYETDDPAPQGSPRGRTSDVQGTVSTGSAKAGSADGDCNELENCETSSPAVAAPPRPSGTPRPKPPHRKTGRRR